MAAIRKIQASVTQIIEYSDTVRKYVLKPAKRSFDFKAGQFLHLATDSYDPSFNWPESRVFSIANSPTRKDLIEVLISRKGKFTGQMFEQLKTGDEVWLKLPYGIFNFDDSMEKDSVLIAGGTGISPFMSFLQYAIDKELNPAISLNYGVNNSDLIIINDLIKEATQKLPNFKYELYIENPNSKQIDLQFNTGILDINKIINNSLKLNEPVFYLSGPPVMIENFEQALKNAGIKAQNIKYDIWE